MTICGRELCLSLHGRGLCLCWPVQTAVCIWIHEGNGLEIFRIFCEELSPEEREKIEIVAGDGAKWIDACTKTYFPNATRCIDFFHVAEWANEKLDKVRTRHAQVNMVTDVYSHIIDEDRKRNAELFEEAFYEKKNLNPKMDKSVEEKTVSLPEGLDAELLGKVLANPEMVALLSSLAKSLK